MNIKKIYAISLLFLFFLIAIMLIKEIKGSDYLNQGLLYCWDFTTDGNPNFGNYGLSSNCTKILGGYGCINTERVYNLTIPLPVGNATFGAIFSLGSVGSSTYSIFSRAVASSQLKPYECHWLNEATDTFYCRFGDGTSSSYVSYADTLDTSEHIITFRKYGQDYYLDFDGINRDADSTAQNVADDTTRLFTSGVRQYGDSSAINIYQLAIWNKTLNSTEFVTYYNSGNGVLCSDFLWGNETIPTSNITLPLNDTLLLNETLKYLKKVNEGLDMIWLIIPIVSFIIAGFVTKYKWLISIGGFFLIILFIYQGYNFIAGSDKPYYTQATYYFGLFAGIVFIMIGVIMQILDITGTGESITEKKEKQKRKKQTKDNFYNIYD